MKKTETKRTLTLLTISSISSFFRDEITLPAIKAPKDGEIPILLESQRKNVITEIESMRKFSSPPGM